jgi:hypothetical protein
VKKRNIYDEPKYTQTESIIIDNDMNPNNTNGVLSPFHEVVVEPINDIENSTSSELLKNPKKRPRKRTHKKNKKNLKPVEKVIFLIFNIIYFILIL